MIRRLSYFLFFILLILALPNCAQAKQYFKELLLRIELNGKSLSEIALILQDRQGQLLVSAADLEHWRFRIPNAAPFIRNKEAFYSLNDMPGVQTTLLPSKMVLKILAEPKVFKSQSYKVKAYHLNAKRPESIGSYLNYDLNMPPNNGQLSLNGVFELGVFGPYGVMNHSVLMNSQSFKSPLFASKNGLIRLNSVWTYDMPESMTSLRVGDSITQAGMWGRAVSYGGLQFSTNFATQPRFISYPLPTISGQAVLPSIVDLYINNAHIYQKQVEPGPFDIRSLPAINGQGEMTLVTRDLMGRERVISVPYYASSNLLAKDLLDFSISAGFVRNNYGLDSFDYDKPFISAVYRKGISDNFTRELQASVARHNQVIGIGGTYLLHKFILLDGAAVVSHSSNGNGALLNVGAERNSTSFNFGTDITYTTKRFQQLGTLEQSQSPKLQSTIYFGIPVFQRGSLGLSFVSRQYYQAGQNSRLLSGSYSMNFSQDWTGILTGLTNIGGTNSKGIFFTLTRRIGKTNTASVNYNRQNDTTQYGMQFNHSSPERYGLDYYGSIYPGANGNLQSGLNWSTVYGDYNAQFSYQDKQRNYMFNGSGSIAYFAEQFQFGPRLTNSFGVVQVPGYDKVGIYLDNQLIARTNQRGYAFLPNLRAFDDNQITIDPTTIPLNAQVKQTVMHAVPYYHSGLFMKFDIYPDQDALLTVVDKNGQPLPPGTEIRFKNQPEIFPIAYSGELYLTGLRQSNTMIANWAGHKCQFTVNYQPSKDPLPNLGRFVCQ